jgi:glycosyltransferase involved in cell wall biosynthesis
MAKAKQKSVKSSSKKEKQKKILFLSQRFLFPQDTGGKIRTSKILEHLNQHFSITVISNLESSKDDSYVSQMRTICDKFIPVPWKEPKRYSLRFYWEIFKKSFSFYPVTMLNDFSPELEDAVLKELESDKYNLAICDFMQSTLNFRKVKNIPVILFQHNVESTISKRHMKRAKDPISIIFWWLQFRKMFYHEKRQSHRFDKVISVSEKDKETMEEWYNLANVVTIPTGVDTDFYSPNGSLEESKQFVFVGAMDWLPNDDAMKYFLEKIFPLIQNEEPDSKFIIVGRNPSPKLQRMVKNIRNVEATGWVDDTRPYISKSNVFIVPIRIGGGTRMKIYEGMSMAKPIVSTSIGAEGLPLTNNEHIIYADEEREFAKSVIHLLRNEKERKRLGDTARKYVHENFGWSSVAMVFAQICETVITENKRRY